MGSLGEPQISENFHDTKIRIDSAFQHLRTEMKEIQRQDIVLLKQLMYIRHTILMLSNYPDRRSYSISALDPSAQVVAPPDMMLRRRPALTRVQSAPLERNVSEDTIPEEDEDDDELAQSFNSTASDSHAPAPLGRLGSGVTAAPRLGRPAPDTDFIYALGPLPPVFQRLLQSSAPEAATTTDDSVSIVRTQHLLKEANKIPAQVSDPVNRTNAPSSDPIHRANTPSSDPIHRANTPSSDPIHRANTPSSDPIHRANTPSSDPIHRANTPISDPIYRANTPSSDPIYRANTPSSDPIYGANTPSSDPIHRANTPSADPIYRANTPSSDPIHRANTPSADPIHRANTPSADPINRVNTPSDDLDKQSNKPSHEQTYTPSHEQVNLTYTPSPEQLKRIYTPSYNSGSYDNSLRRYVTQRRMLQRQSSVDENDDDVTGVNAINKKFTVTVQLRG